MALEMIDLSLTGNVDPFYAQDNHQRLLATRGIDPKKYYKLARKLVLEYGYEQRDAQRMIEKLLSLDNARVVATVGDPPVDMTERGMAAVAIDFLSSGLMRTDTYSFKLDKAAELAIQFSMETPNLNTVLPHPGKDTAGLAFDFDNISLKAGNNIPNYDPISDIGVLRPFSERKYQVIPLSVIDLEDESEQISKLSIAEDDSRIINTNGKRQFEGTRQGKLARLYDTPVKADSSSMFGVREWTPYMLIRRERRIRALLAAALRSWRSRKVNEMRTTLWGMGFVDDTDRNGNAGQSMNLKLELNYIREKAISEYDRQVLATIHDQYLDLILVSNACSRDVTVEELRTYTFEFFDMCWDIDLLGKKDLADQRDHIGNLISRYHYSNVTELLRDWLRMKALFSLTENTGNALNAVLVEMTSGPTSTNESAAIASLYGKLSRWAEEKTSKYNKVTQRTPYVDGGEAPLVVTATDRHALDHFDVLLGLEVEELLVDLAKTLPPLVIGSSLVEYYAARNVMSAAADLTFGGPVGPITDWPGFTTAGPDPVPISMRAFDTALVTILSLGLGKYMAPENIILDLGANGTEAFDASLAGIKDSTGTALTSASISAKDPEFFTKMWKEIADLVTTRVHNSVQWKNQTSLHDSLVIARTIFTRDLGAVDMDLSGLYTGVLYTAEEQEHFDTLMRLKDMNLVQNNSRARSKRRTQRVVSLHTRLDGGHNTFSLHNVVENPLKGLIDGAKPVYRYETYLEYITGREDTLVLHMAQESDSETQHTVVLLPTDFSGYVYCEVTVRDQAGLLIARGKGPLVMVEQFDTCVRCRQNFSPFNSDTVRDKRSVKRGVKSVRQVSVGESALRCKWRFNVSDDIRRELNHQVTEEMADFMSLRGILTRVIEFHMKKPVNDRTSEWFFNNLWLSMDGMDKDRLLGMVEHAATIHKRIDMYKQLSQKDEEEHEAELKKFKKKMLTKLGLWEKLNLLFETDRALGKQDVPQLYTHDTFTNAHLTRVKQVMTSGKDTVSDIVNYIFQEVPYLVVLNYVVKMVDAIIAGRTKSQPPWLPTKINVINPVDTVLQYMKDAALELGLTAMRLMSDLCLLKCMNDRDDSMTVSEIYPARQVLVMSAYKMTQSPELLPRTLPILQEIEGLFPVLKHRNYEPGQGIAEISVAYKTLENWHSAISNTAPLPDRSYIELASSTFFGLHSANDRMPYFFELGYGDGQPIERNIEDENDLRLIGEERGLSLLYGDNRDISKLTVEYDQERHRAAIEKAFDDLASNRALIFYKYNTLVRLMKDYNEILAI